VPGDAFLDALLRSVSFGGRQDEAKIDRAFNCRCGTRIRVALGQRWLSQRYKNARLLEVMTIVPICESAAQSTDHASTQGKLLDMAS
jgi:hypothetical protein